MNRKPSLVAICGNPQSGKSTLQKVLQNQFGLIPRDDGDVIRSHCMRIGNLKGSDVYTQEGKSRLTGLNGRIWQNRIMLGEYGKMLEQMFGENIVPDIAIREALQHWDETPNPAHRGYSFGSVRRNQGRKYKEYGGVVIEVVRQNAPPSGNDFDEFDRSIVDVVVENDFATTGELTEYISRMGLLAELLTAA